MPALAEKRLDPGIPVGHGLTIHEAVLMYDSDAGHYGRRNNFTAANLARVHTLISPWRDFVIPYGGQQTLIGLGWGDEENFIYLR